jgi:hypothetical protein
MRSPALTLSAAALALLVAAPTVHSAPPAAPAASAVAPAAADSAWVPGDVLYQVSVGSTAQGNLRALTARLDTLNDGNPHSFGDLGVDALYLVRGAGDGTAEDLAALLAAARKRQLKVILAAPGASAAGAATAAALPKSADAALAAALVDGAKSGQAGGIAAQLLELAHRSPQGVGATPYLTRHAYPLDGLGREKSAAAVLLTLPGAPFLYAGDELGGGEKATWTAETSDPDSLLSAYRFLIRARHNSEALRKGNLTVLTRAGDTTPVLAFLRETEGEKVLVLHNLGDTPIEAGPYKVPGAPDPFFVSPGVPPPSGTAGAFKVKLPAHGSGIWKMRVR